MGSDLAPVDAVSLLGRGDHLVHHRADVVHIEAGAVERAVGHVGGQNLSDAAHAARANRVLGFHDESACTHAEDHPVAPSIEGQRSARDLGLGGGCPGREEPRAFLPEHRVAGHIIGGDDDDAVAASRTDPVFGGGHGQGR